MTAKASRGFCRYRPSGWDCNTRRISYQKILRQTLPEAGDDGGKVSTSGEASACLLEGRCGRCASVFGQN
jgi:hypothetical protein